jgi:hypothetical protein
MQLLENVGIDPPLKGTVGATLQNFQKPKEGKKYSFHRMGRGVWKLVDNEVVPKARAKRKPMPVTSTPIIGQEPPLPWGIYRHSSRKSSSR